jgi:polyisoprenoid-binding protein YceI
MRISIFAGAVAALGVLGSIATLAPVPARAQQAPAAVDPTGSWGIDASHSRIEFSVVHLGVSRTRGKFSEFDGKIVADPKNLGKSSVNFTIQAKSIDTGNTGRDEHLRGADFFETTKYPTITFASTKIARRGRGYLATGNLTLHGVTKQISFPFTVTGPVKGFKPGEARAGVQATLTLSRKDYGLLWNRVIEGTNSVGDEVTIEIDIEGIKS